MYNDEQLPSVEVLEKMNSEFKQVEVCEVGEYRQRAEVEEIYSKLLVCENFFKWLESTDPSFSAIKQLLNNVNTDKINTLACCGRGGLDMRYACEKDFNNNCCNYCNCEMEIIDKVIKLLSLKNSIVDKQYMIKLVSSRMQALKLIFNKYCK